VPFDQFDLSVLDAKAPPAPGRAYAAPRAAATAALPESDRDMLRQLILEELKGLTGGLK